VRIAAVLLAAGTAQRFGGPSKLLATLGGVPLIQYPARAIAASHVAYTLAVTGREAAAIERALSGFSCQFIHNPSWSEGLGGSVAVGVRALPDDVDGVLIVPGDMPFLTAAFLNALIEQCEHAPAPRPIIFPQLPDGNQSNPVLWPSRFFTELSHLTGVVGAKALLKVHAAHARAYPVSDAVLLTDIDTLSDLELAQRLVPFATPP
jgi:molybdenum cofactor cytidylyltransferase